MSNSELNRQNKYLVNTRIINNRRESADYKTEESFIYRDDPLASETKGEVEIEEEHLVP